MFRITRRRQAVYCSTGYSYFHFNFYNDVKIFLGEFIAGGRVSAVQTESEYSIR